MPANSEPASDDADAVLRIVVLPKHLHARPAGKIAQAASRHPATTVELHNGHRKANARSVLGVMGLGAVAGSEVRVLTTGAGADAVADEIVDILCAPEDDQP
jgi:phosphotransferase system HPr (HPr) family protein